MDIESIKNLLKESRLLTNDLNRFITNFIVAEVNNKIIGVGGFEKHDEIGLLRSFAVTPEYRGKKIGKRIYQIVENKIFSTGIEKIYLLTETAIIYFKGLGFSIKERDSIPESIKQTRQFNELCPSSENIMYIELSANKT